jgi:hypothetical protein
MEYRSKLLNPRWAQAMAAQGSGGAYEISTRMTALLGWGGTVGYTDSFTWDQVGLRVLLEGWQGLLVFFIIVLAWSAIALMPLLLALLVCVPALYGWFVVL